jgi:hypothetical protein
LGVYYCHCFPFSFSASLSLLNITCTLLPPTTTLISGKAAISAVSGHSNARQSRWSSAKGKRYSRVAPRARRPQPARPPKGQRSPRSSASLCLAWPVLAHSPLPSLSQALLLSGLSLPVSVCPCLQAANSSVLFLYCRSCSHRSFLDCRTSSLQARLLPPRLHRSCLQPACLPRLALQDRERHDTTAFPWHHSDCQAPTLSTALISTLRRRTSLPRTTWHPPHQTLAQV